LRQDRPVVDLLGCDVDRRAGHLDPDGQSVPHRVPALEGRQQRRVRVQHPPGEGGGQAGDDRAEPGHGHDVDAVRPQHLHEPLAVGLAVEGRPPLGALDELAGHAVLVRDGERPARPVCDDHRDGEPFPQHGVQ
jgi:hypothetical protein